MILIAISYRLAFLHSYLVLLYIRLKKARREMDCWNLEKKTLVQCYFYQ